MIRLLLALLFVGCLTLATSFDAPMNALRAQSGQGTSIMSDLVGDGRRMFANEFFAKADEYFHSGYYPTIFDNAKSDEDVTGAEDKEKAAKGGKEEPEEGFMGKPRDFIEKFGRNFIPTVHTHLANGNQREILPWLRLSADMDPHRVQTYLTASYWLRTALNKPSEAARFLREGLNANPDSYDLLIELGYVYFYNYNDATTARRIWGEALQKWKKADAAGGKPPLKAELEILDDFVRADQQLEDLPGEIADLEILKTVSPGEAAIEKRLAETRAALQSQQGQK